MNTTEEKHDIAVIPAIARTLKTLADGTVRINLDVEPSYRDTAMCLFGEPGVTVAVARLKLDVTQPEIHTEEHDATV